MTTEYYDLTPAQQLSFLNRRWTVHKNIVNIPTSVQVDQDLDLDVLERAVRLCVGRWDAFGLRFVKHGLAYQQYFGERDCLYVERAEFRDQAERDAFCEHRGRRRLRLVDAPQAGFVVFRMADGGSGLFSVVNHLVLDSWALSMFYKDVFEVYWALVQGADLPKAPPEYRPTLIRELEYQGSERCEADRRFWQAELCVTEPTFVSIRGSQVLEAYRKRTRNPDVRAGWTTYLRTKADHVVRIVDAEDVACCRAFADEHRSASLQVLFCLALRLYLAKVNGRADDVMLGINVARRGTVREKNCGGSLVQPIRLRTTISEDLTFLEAVEVVAERQGSAFKHLDFSSMETTFMPQKAFREQGSKEGTNYYDVHMTFQPVPMEVGHGLTASTQWYCNGATSMPVYLTIMDDDGSGGLRFYWERNVRHVPVEVLDACQDFMVAALRAGTTDPSITVGELFDLTAGDLAVR